MRSTKKLVLFEMLIKERVSMVVYVHSSPPLYEPPITQLLSLVS